MSVSPGVGIIAKRVAIATLAAMFVSFAPAAAADAPQAQAQPQTPGQPQAPHAGANNGRSGSPILLEADEVTYDTNKNVVTAHGHVQIADATRVLLADTVSYDQNTDIITADGNVSLLEPDGNVGFADHVTLTSDLAEGAMQGFKALIGPNGRMVASTAERHQGRYTIGHAAVYTPCKICQTQDDTTPVWQIRAVQVTHDQLAHELRFHDATLEFLGVPVAYLPFFSTPDPTVKHQTGFLRPSFGNSTNLGTYVKVPYYIAFSDSQDLTIEPFITSGAGDIVDVEYRQRWDGGGMWVQASLGYNADASPIEHEWMSHLFGSIRVPLGDNWRLGSDVQLTSNDTYLRIYDISEYDRLTTDLFVDHVDGRSRFAVTGYFFQGLRPTDTSGQMPYVLPLVEYTYIPESRVFGGRLRVEASGLALYRSAGEDTLRGSASADWYLPYTTDNGQVLSVEALVRADQYRIEDGLEALPPAPADTIDRDRELAVAAFEWRWPFVRENSFGNANLVVEPIAQLVVEPYGGNPNSIPNEDSTAFAFDETNLFNIDVFPGLDRVSTGTRINAGTRISLIFPTGLVEALIGEEYRLHADQQFPPSLGIGGDHSDIVGAFKVEFAPYIQLIHRWRIDPETGSLRDNEVYLSARYGRTTFDVAYLRLSQQEVIDPTLLAREEIDADASINVYGNWNVFGLVRRDLQNSQMIETRAGVSYEDECFLASLGYRRRYTSDRDLKPGTSIMMTFSLKTGLDESSTEPGSRDLPKHNLPL